MSVPSPTSVFPSDPLRAAAAAYADRVAIETNAFTLSWNGLDAAVDRAALKLSSSGVEAESRVAIRSDEPVSHLVAHLALVRIGAVAVPLSTRWPEARWRAAVRTAGASRVLFEGDGMPDIEEIRALVGMGKHPTPAPPRPGDDRWVTAVFTSGSTGEPRAAVHRLSAHLASAEGANEVLGVDSSSRWLLSLPLYHVGGLAILYRAMRSGAAIVIADRGKDLTKIIVHRQVTHVSMVETQLRRALPALRSAPVPALRCILTGGGPINPDLLRDAASVGLPVAASWGMTETASMVTCTRIGVTGIEAGSAGRVLPGRTVRISDTGEIVVGGAVLLDAYLVDGRPVPARGADGDFRSGDLGWMDEGGRLFVRGRKDNQFVSGGENVQPEAIEAVLRTVPGVVDAIVVPVGDLEFGQRPVAFVEGDADRPDLVQAVEASLARFMIPDAFYPMPAIAGSATKRSRADLARIAQERATA